MWAARLPRMPLNAPLRHPLYYPSVPPNWPVAAGALELTPSYSPILDLMPPNMYLPFGPAPPAIVYPHEHLISRPVGTLNVDSFVAGGGLPLNFNYYGAGLPFELGPGCVSQPLLVPWTPPASESATPPTSRPPTRSTRRTTRSRLVGCYILTPANPTSFRMRACYVGCTERLIQRLREHNGNVTGGAKATDSDDHRPWEMLCVVTGFRDKSEVESDLIRAQKELHGLGVGTPRSVKRKFIELFRLINSSTWRKHRLRITFSTPESMEVARKALGPRKRWPKRMRCETRAVPDLVRKVGPVSREQPYCEPAARSTVELPPQRDLARVLFSRVDEATCVCSLCGEDYVQKAVKGYDNLCRHLRLMHGKEYLTEFSRRHQ